MHAFVNRQIPNISKTDYVLSLVNLIAYSNIALTDTMTIDLHLQAVHFVLKDPRDKLGWSHNCYRIADYFCGEVQAVSDKQLRQFMTKLETILSTFRARTQ